LRWLTLLAVSSSVLSCGRPAPPVRPTGAEPDLRVGLRTGADRITLSGQGAVVASQNGSPVFRLAARSQITITPEGRALQVSGEGSGRYQQLAFVSLAPNQYVTIDGRPYRGAVEVTSRGGGLTVVNTLPLESYLMGVVTAEMGRRARNEHAALEAQAVVSRTYALRNRGRFGSQGFDLQAGVSDQVYGGVANESEEGVDAVRGTAGVVLTYGGELITAFFHSTCGASTASPEEVFRTVRNQPYLRPVSDRRSGGYYCDISPRFRWTVEWDGSLLRDILRRTLPVVLGIDADAVEQIRDIYVRRTGPSGRAREVRVRVGDGEIPIPGHDVRAVFQTPEGRSLGSTAIELNTERQGGQVVRVTAAGGGWGHGVGLCQWGAVGRARAGQDYETILTTYFPGTTLARWY